MEFAQHDELVQLFARNMHLSQQQQQQQQQPQPQQQNPTIQRVSHSPELKTYTPLHFASAHYTHTAHVRSDTQSEPSRSPPPPYHEAMMPDGVAETLRQNSIDPSALFPNQIDLFLHADYEQRLRLLELWRISPPSYALDQRFVAESHFTRTSLEQEESEARLRYEKQMLARAVPQAQNMPHSLVPESEPLSLVRREEEPAWPQAARTRAASISAAAHSMAHPAEAEPYIVNGYEIASNKHSVDPVYAAGLWRAPSYTHAVPHQSQMMEDQYGMYEQIRNHASWERVNERIAREQLGGLHASTSMDEEMVM